MGQSCPNQKLQVYLVVPAKWRRHNTHPNNTHSNDKASPTLRYSSRKSESSSKSSRALQLIRSMVVQGEETMAQKEPKKESPSSPKEGNHKPKGLPVSNDNKTGSTAPMYMYPAPHHHALHYYPPYDNRPLTTSTEAASNNKSLRGPPGPYTTAQYDMRKSTGAPIPPYAEGSSPSTIGRDPPPPPHHFHHLGEPAAFYHDEHHRGPPPPPPPPPPHRWGEYPPYFDPAGPPPYPSRASYVGPMSPPMPVKEAASSSPMGPYRFSDTTLRREAQTNLKSKPTPSEDPDPSRDGATSPSQIDSSHREEVTTMGCTCKKTKCLKLYCQCFAVKIYCGSNCRCSVCNNTAEHEKIRQAAIRSILSRNPQAFDTKYKKSIPDKAAPELAHKLGCKCRKSACMKKYCECYAGSVRCSDNCRCVGCKNVGRGAPAQPHRTAMLPPLTVNHGPNLLVAAIAAQSVDPNPIAQARARKQEPYMMNTAAHNLAFLKHGSPVPDKSAANNNIVRGPTLQEGDMGSMPSLASEESPRMAAKPAGESFGFQPNTAEKAAVNALLMAAVAMAEMSTQSVPLPDNQKQQPQQDPVSTPPDAKTTGIAEEDDDEIVDDDEDCKTPQKNLLNQFQSPKRKQTETTTHYMDTTPRTVGGLRPEDEGESSTESSPSGSGGDSNDDSPKRDLAGMEDLTPSVQQKNKRSRIGSVRKGASRNLGQEMAQGRANSSMMVMETPKHLKSSARNELTPVSARCIDFKRMNMGTSTPEPMLKDPLASNEASFETTKPLTAVSRNPP